MVVKSFFPYSILCQSEVCLLERLLEVRLRYGNIEVMLQPVSSLTPSTSFTREGPPQNFLKLFVELCLSKFNPTLRTFEEFELKLEKFNSLLDTLTQACKCEYDKDLYSGFIHRLEAPVGSTFTVQADLHGDLASLICLLQALRKEGFVNENYLPKEGHYLIFLGDYTDRGRYNLEVLFILVLLRAQSERVILLRGNHEEVGDHATYLGYTKGTAYYDPAFAKYLESTKNKERLQAFYETLPHALYLTPIAPQPEYFIICHGLPPYHFDPQLHFGAPFCQLVPRKIVLSERVKQLQISALERLLEADEREDNEMVSLFLNARIRDLTDVWNGHFTADDVHAILSAQVEKVRMIVRGHDHKFNWHLAWKEKKWKPVAITLPAAMGGALRGMAIGEEKNPPLALTFTLQNPLTETPFHTFYTEVVSGPMHTTLMRGDPLYLARA